MFRHRRFYRFGHRPQRGDKFNDRNRGPWRSNGFVHAILWKEDPKEVIVKFWTKTERMESDSYTFDELEGNWTDHFGGTWIIPKEVDAIQLLLNAVFGLT